MKYYFIRHATTATGPWNFATYTNIRGFDRYTITEAVEIEARNRGVIVCHDWVAIPIDRSEWLRLSA